MADQQSDPDEGSIYMDCWRCGGEGYVEQLDEDDDGSGDCIHFVRCPVCKGRGAMETDA